jgi:aerobic carbon-monoxide dehydrogenase small subunit
MSLHEITLTVNATLHRAQVPARLTLVDFLRDLLRLTGTHAGCEHGVCGACSILLDDRPVRSCLLFAVQADGCRIVTVEGLAPDRESLSVLQDSFCETHALQCGFCTPGILMSFTDFLARNPKPTEQELREVLSGHICRCTGYAGIMAALKEAVGIS